MYCQICGNKINEGEQFCLKCGTKVTDNLQNSGILNNDLNNINQGQYFANNNNFVSSNNQSMPEQNSFTQSQNFAGNMGVSSQNNFNQSNSEGFEDKKIENNASSNMQNDSNNSKKKNGKRKWWGIPVAVFFALLGSVLFGTILKLIINVSESSGGQASFLLKTLVNTLSMIGAACLILLTPAIIFAIVMSIIKPSDDYEEKINNFLNGDSSLDEKMLVAFIGANYDKITSKKFSVSGLFYGWLYMEYRKMYIPAILLEVVIFIISKISSPLSIVVTIISFLIIGLNINKWYVLYAKKQINKIKSEYPNASERELFNICKRKGGTNFGYVILIYIVLMLIGSLFSKNNDLNKNIWNLYFALPNNFVQKNEKIALFTYEVEYDASSYQHCEFKLFAQNSASSMSATYGLHSPDNYLYKDYSAIEEKNINSNTWYYQTKTNSTYVSHFYSTKYNDAYYLIEFKIGNISDNQDCNEYYNKIISSLEFK